MGSRNRIPMSAFLRYSSPLARASAEPETRNLDVYTQWLQETQQALKQSRSDQDVQETLQRRLDVLLEKMRSLDPELDNRLQDLANAYFRYFAMRRDLAFTLITDPAWTLEYTN